MEKKSSKKNVFDIKLLRRIFTFTQPYKNKFYTAIFLSVLLAVMAPLRPLLIQISINEGIKDTHAGYLLKGPGAFLIEVTIFQIVFLLIESVTRFYFSFSTASLGQSVVKDLRNLTYNKILNLNLTQFDRTPIGTLTTRTINDIESINDIFSDGLIPIVADLLAILSVLTYMFITDWKISLICILPFPILIIATYYFKESVNKSFTGVRNAVSQLNAFVQEHLTGMSIIQSFAAEQREQNKFEQINKTHRDQNIKAIFAYSIFLPIVELVSAISIGLMVWWAAKESTNLSAAASEHIAGIITSFILCLNLLFRPLRIIADKFNVLQMGMIASERVFLVIDNQDITPALEKQNAHKIVEGEIEFEHVWFSYSAENYVLKDISFKVPAGKTYAIVGNTGSGKTSIISLINRLYQFNKGAIKIDGIEIQQYSIEALRSKIAVVLQDVFLFSGSVMDNITLRNSAIEKEDVIAASKLIGLHDFIMQLPGEYNYQVMERGATLSVGQRQLISFARALLYNPSILILDEATSSIDSESEILVQQAIDKLIKGRTSIVIAHRLSTIKKADTIIVLSKGEIIEMGSHEELLSLMGSYYQLYQTQFENNNKAE